jgi:pilus assembly protein Flp/PilA
LRNELLRQQAGEASIMIRFAPYFRDDSGASAAEYALILALIALVIIVSVTTLGTNINSIFSQSATSI